jgi:hypothetical protein
VTRRAFPLLLDLLSAIRVTNKGKELDHAWQWECFIGKGWVQKVKVSGLEACGRIT